VVQHMETGDVLLLLCPQLSSRREPDAREHALRRSYGV
jgi:hypothetical protein